MHTLQRSPRRWSNRLRRLQLHPGREEPPRPRHFTQNSQLLLTCPATPRPQLPFLHPPSRHTPFRGRTGQWHLARLITTEQKKYIKDQLRLGGKYTLYGWGFLVLISIISFGWHEEKLERHIPSPPDYTWWSRLLYRSALEEEDPEWTQGGVTDWSMAGSRWKELVRRLEHPKIDGKGIVEQEEGGILVPGVGKAGYNIEAKSYPWRKGYYDALMGMARVAERLDGWLRDDRGLAFPAENVIGPSNPNPRPVAPNQHSAPREENCRPAWEPPETFYMRILTTKGFTTKQRLTAALAYADWLDYKGLPEAAKSMFEWALDIASSGRSTSYPNNTPVVDTKTGIIREEATSVSPNILLASTSLGIHHARNNDTSSALPIFLSVLRARRAAPRAPTPPPQIQGDADTSSIPRFIRNLLVPPKFPPPGPSGDEPVFRTFASQCEEAGLMTYIGEIFFASSPQASSTSSASTTAASKDQLEGLSWTRSAVDLAEASLLDPKLKSSRRNTCQSCLDVSLNNWVKMVGRLAKEERKASEEQKRRMAESHGQRKSWLSWVGANGQEVKEQEEGRWAAEERVVERRMAETRALLFQQRITGVGNALFGPG